VLGCGVEIKSKHNRELSTFDLNNLRWSKIIICTDADVDGYQIRTLILAMLYRLVPTLIQVGKVFIAESPLFEIRTKDKPILLIPTRKRMKSFQSLRENTPYCVQKDLAKMIPI